MDKIAVLIPCYNESQTIGKVILDLKKILPEAVIYVYDNNSSDGTDRIAGAHGAIVRYEHQLSIPQRYQGHHDRIPGIQL